MRLALLVSLAPDRRSGRVHGDPLPAHEAVAQVKEFINDGQPLDPHFPIVVAFALDSTLREHRFKPTEEDILAFGNKPREATIEDMEAALGQCETRLAEAEEAAEIAMAFSAARKIELDGSTIELNALKIRMVALQAAEQKLASVPADLAEAAARMDAIRDKLSGISEKVSKSDILKIIEAALAA